MPPVRIDPVDHLLNRSALVQDVDGVAGIAPRDRIALIMGIDVNPRQPIGIVCQALFVDPLLN
jgi:hypothetical protein